MDLRVEKTEKAIRNAFLELRAKRALEKISVKELCQLAEINKSTFYAHYRDVYDLSDTLEAETVASILDSLPKEREYSVHSVEQFTRDLCLAFAAHISLINILFSGKEHSGDADRAVSLPVLGLRREICLCRSHGYPGKQCFCV